MTIMIVDNDCDGYDCQQCNDHDDYDVVNNHGVAISYDHLHSPSVIGLLARFFLQSWVKNVDSGGKYFAWWRQKMYTEQWRLLLHRQNCGDHIRNHNQLPNF